MAAKVAAAIANARRSRQRVAEASECERERLVAAVGGQTEARATLRRLERLMRTLADC